MPYMEEAVALSESAKDSVLSRHEYFLKVMIRARTTLATCYYRLGRYDDAAAAAKLTIQACEVSIAAVTHDLRK